MHKLAPEPHIMSSTGKQAMTNLAFTTPVPITVKEKVMECFLVLLQVIKQNENLNKAIHNLDVLAIVELHSIIELIIQFAASNEAYREREVINIEAYFTPKRWKVSETR